MFLAQTRQVVEGLRSIISAIPFVHIIVILAGTALFGLGVGLTLVPTANVGKALDLEDLSFGSAFIGLLIALVVAAQAISRIFS